MTSTKPEEKKKVDKPKSDGKKLEKPTKSTGKLEKGKIQKKRLGTGVYQQRKLAIYKFLGKKVKKTPKKRAPKYKIKPIRGDKNGKERKVLLKKRRNYYPTLDKIKKRPAKKLFKNHVRHLRTSLVPGTVVILLAGAHKGKRVVFLKQLRSGLLLVTGPFVMNACPLRRISQRYVIATETRINLKGVKLPKNLNDEYFRRKREKKQKKKKEDAGDIFQQKKEKYKVSEQRKTDQKTVDKALVSAIKKHPDSKALLAYLTAMFGLRSSQYPHRLKF